MFDNIQLWKLHTLSDYVNILLIFAPFFLFAALFTHYQRKGRTDAAAQKRVCKKLKGWSNGRLTIMHDLCGVVDSGEQGQRAIIVCSSGVYLLHCYGWGTTVSGKSTDQIWKLIHGEERRLIPNPLSALAPDVQQLVSRLSAHGLSIPVMPLVVFADNFSSPTLKLDTNVGPHVISRAGLKAWCKTYCPTVLSQDALQAVREALL